jgi:hypothetical protein
MSKSPSKRTILTRSDELTSKYYNDQRSYTTRQCRKRSPSPSQDNGKKRTIKRRSQKSPRPPLHGLRKSRAHPLRSVVLSVYQRSSIETPNDSNDEDIRSTTEEYLEKPSSTSSGRKSQSTDTVDSQPVAPLDRITKDEIIRKVSTCLSFYGNFVIIPAIKKTLNKIEKKDKNVTFSYWHEVMTFIDSYDLPYTSELRKKLVDELVEKITKYVENEGISAQDWQNIICTLPDDVSSKFDHRLEFSVMEAVATLAEQDQLPFNLSKSITQLLESAKKHAGQYIRNNKS